MKKRKYYKPDVAFIKFDNDDIIVTSGCGRDTCTTVEPIVGFYNYDLLEGSK